MACASVGLLSKLFMNMEALCIVQCYSYYYSSQSAAASMTQLARVDCAFSFPLLSRPCLFSCPISYWPSYLFSDMYELDVRDYVLVLVCLHILIFLRKKSAQSEASLLFIVGAERRRRSLSLVTTSLCLFVFPRVYNASGYISWHVQCGLLRDAHAGRGASGPLNFSRPYTFVFLLCKPSR